MIEVGDIVYRRGSPRSIGVVTAVSDWFEDSGVPKIWNGTPIVKVTWKKKNTGNTSRITNSAGPDDWVSYQIIGGKIDDLIAETSNKLNYHCETKEMALAWAQEEGLV